MTNNNICFKAAAFFTGESVAPMLISPRLGWRHWEEASLGGGRRPASEEGGGQPWKRPAREEASLGRGQPGRRPASEEGGGQPRTFRP